MKLLSPGWAQPAEMQNQIHGFMLSEQAHAAAANISNAAVTDVVPTARFSVPIGSLAKGEPSYTFPVTAKVLARSPGSTGTFAVDLRPGRYTLMCFVRGDDGRPHLRMGMISEFRVEG